MEIPPNDVVACMIAATTMKKRKCAGTHLVAGGPAASRVPAIAALVLKATPTPKATLVPNAHPREMWKLAGKGKKKKHVLSCTALPPVAPSPSFLNAPHDENIGANNVFDDILGRYEIFKFL
jgi:hypothetical protein